MRKPGKRSAIAATAVALAGVGAITFASLADGAPTTPSQPNQSKIFGTNARGQAFGSGDVANDAQLPDLIGVIATNGKEGYVKKSDYRRPPLSLDQIRALPSQVVNGKKVFVSPSRLIPVYASDGTTVIGQFEAAGG